MVVSPNTRVGRDIHILMPPSCSLSGLLYSHALDFGDFQMLVFLGSSDHKVQDKPGVVPLELRCSIW